MTPRTEISVTLSAAEPSPRLVETFTSPPAPTRSRNGSRRPPDSYEYASAGGGGGGGAGVPAGGGTGAAGAGATGPFSAGGFPAAAGACEAYAGAMPTAQTTKATVDGRMLMHPSLGAWAPSAPPCPAAQKSWRRTWP